MGPQFERNDRGLALLSVLVLTLVLVLLSTVLVQMGGQETLSAAGAKQTAVTHQVADAAVDAVTAWFHHPRLVPTFAEPVLAKRHRTVAGSPTFFDTTGRSQFVGTSDHPDLVLNAEREEDNRLLNDPATGFFRTLSGVGTVQTLKLYAPLTPGLLSTVEAVVSPAHDPSTRAILSVQLAAEDLPALRAGIQVGGNLGLPFLGQESPAMVHWGDLTVGGQWVIQQVEEIPALSKTATVNGLSYQEVGYRDDRWGQAWVGGTVYVTRPLLGEGHTPLLPLHIHSVQNPVPGVRRDQWDYAHMKALAKQYGAYAALDRDGLVYPDGVVVAGHGLSADDWLRTTSVGQGHGLVVIDTLDQAAPHGDNLGSVTLHAPYVEGTLVVFGHVTLSPATGTGQSLSVRSPPTSGGTEFASRVPVSLSGIHLNGALYATGNITVTGAVRVFGAIVTDGTIVSGLPGSTVEVWYNHELSQGLVRGLPLVSRAPGTWLVHY